MYTCYTDISDETVESELDPEFAEKFITFIVREVVRHHEQIAAEEADEG